MHTTYVEKQYAGTFLSLTPSFGYFFWDNVQLFVALDGNFFFYKDLKNTATQFGLGAKYHRKIGRGSAYAGSSFYANKVEIPDKIVLGAGYMFKLGENVWLDAGTDYSFSIETDDFSILTMGMGLAVFLP